MREYTSQKMQKIHDELNKPKKFAQSVSVAANCIWEVGISKSVGRLQSHRTTITRRNFVADIGLHKFVEPANEDGFTGTTVVGTPACLALESSFYMGSSSRQTTSKGELEKRGIDLHTLLGMSKWRVALGREDGVTTSLKAASINVPSPLQPLAIFKYNFAAIGLNIKDVVVLSVAHWTKKGFGEVVPTRIYLTLQHRKVGAWWFRCETREDGKQKHATV